MNEEETKQELESKEVEDTTPEVAEGEPVMEIIKNIGMLAGGYHRLAESQAEQQRNIDELRSMISGRADEARMEDFMQNNVSKHCQAEDLANDNFREIVKVAYGMVGDDLDSEQLVKLLDNYVNSKIMESRQKELLSNENELATDKLEFKQSGQSKGKLPRMQDIPPEKLESYIAKYI